jgi:hypothetical protein
MGWSLYWVSSPKTSDAIVNAEELNQLTNRRRCRRGATAPPP